MTANRIKLDLKGVECPDFGLSLRSFFRNAAGNTVVLIQATVHNAERDVMALCDFGGHELVAKRANGNGVSEFIVKKVG